MNINATLIGQFITFLLFVIFTMKFIWPPIVQNMQERTKKINQGLIDAENGKRELELAQKHKHKIISEGKLKASHIIEMANERALQIEENAKKQALAQTKIMLNTTETEIKQKYELANQELQNNFSNAVVDCIDKILQDNNFNDANIQKLINNAIETL